MVDGALFGLIAVYLFLGAAVLSWTRHYSLEWRREHFIDRSCTVTLILWPGVMVVWLAWLIWTRP